MKKKAPRDDKGRFVSKKRTQPAQVKVSDKKKVQEKRPSYNKSKTIQRSSLKNNRIVDLHGLQLTVGEKRAQRNITFSGNDPNGKYEKKVRETLKDSFTQKELAAIGKVKVEFGPVKRGGRAEFVRRYEDGDITSIVFDPKQCEEDDFAHEFIHALKAGDYKREGYAATLFKRKGTAFDLDFSKKHIVDLKNIEESTVVAESAIRTKKPAKKAPGYYDEISGIGRNEGLMKKAYDEDRITLLEAKKGTKIEETVGIKGKVAVKKLNRNFEKTKISKKSIAGRTAIESYEKLKNIDKK
jgi:hypothetical protein